MTRTRKLLIGLIVVICLLWAVRLSKIAQQKQSAEEQAATQVQQAVPAQTAALSTPTAPAQETALSTPTASPGQGQPQSSAYAKPDQQITAPKMTQAQQPEVSPLQAKLNTLDEILRSGNDNDPRLDNAFNNMTQQEKRAFEEKYAAMPREKHNQRGTIVYLLGRDPKTKADWAFLSSVAVEAPCQGLHNCDSAEELPNDHRDLGIELTLSYPSMMALRQSENAVKRGDASGMAVVNAAAQSSSRVVSEEAQRFLRQQSKH